MLIVSSPCPRPARSLTLCQWETSLELSSCALVFFCKRTTAYDMRISDWSSDVCSSDLRHGSAPAFVPPSHQQPMGVTLSLARRIELLQEIGRASCRVRVCQYV